MPEFRQNVPFRREWVPEEAENRLQEFRLQKNLTIKQLSDMVEVHDFTYRQVELGELAPYDRNGTIRSWLPQTLQILDTTFDCVFSKEICEFVGFYKVLTRDQYLVLCNRDYCMDTQLDVECFMDHIRNINPEYGEDFLDHIMHGRELPEIAVSHGVTKQYVFLVFRDILDTIKKRSRFYGWVKDY